MFDRIASRGVRAGLLPPALFGHRWLRPAASEVIRAACRELMPNRTLACGLPENIADASLLSHDRGRYERSFAEVPELEIGARRVLTFDAVRMLRIRDRYGNDFHAFLTADGAELPVAGHVYRPEHAELMRGLRPHTRLRSAAWVGTHSTRNHYMWLLTHLPRVLLAQELGLTEDILLPARSLLSAPKLETLERVGLEHPRFVAEDAAITQIDRLTVFDIDAFDPELLHAERNLLTAGSKGQRGARLLLSRARCHYRKLRNEAELVERTPGLEAVFLEDLSFGEQVELLSGAELVVGAHGAGFANLLFCQPGTRVVEIQDPADPNPHFYMLAALMGLRYNLLAASVDDSESPHFRDLELDPAALSDALGRDAGGPSTT